jgi:hypothetical protein
MIGNPEMGQGDRLASLQTCIEDRNQVHEAIKAFQRRRRPANASLSPLRT